jgi:hypothetical protein
LFREGIAVMNTLSGTMADLDRQGFSHHFQVVGQRIRTLDGGGGFGADQVLIREWHRFEGVSDPDDMAIVYALESVNGIRGTLVDAFGAYSDPAISAFMEKVRFSGTGRAPGACILSRSDPMGKGED